MGMVALLTMISQAGAENTMMPTSIHQKCAANVVVEAQVQEEVMFGAVITEMKSIVNKNVNVISWTMHAGMLAQNAQMPLIEQTEHTFIQLA